MIGSGRLSPDHQCALNEGDNVVTLSGIHGTIKKLKDDTVMLQIADNVRVKINRTSIANKKQ